MTPLLWYLSAAMELNQFSRQSSRSTRARRSTAASALAIGTTHTQARYVLPEVIRAYRLKHPQVQLHLHQGTPEQVADLFGTGQIDIAIGTGSEHLFPDAVILPAYHWYLSIVVPIGHPLARESQATVRSLRGHPLVTYDIRLEGAASMRETLAAGGFEPRIVLTATNSEVVKTYVRLGMGVGIVPRMAIDPQQDGDLVVIDAEGLFPRHTTWVAFRQRRHLRRPLAEFLQYFAPHLARRRVERVSRLMSDVRLGRVFSAEPLTVR